tara:strand:+ start:98 stop:388 length:291 start_codon:yes stop_codon:yes gene_type:complete
MPAYVVALVDMKDEETFRAYQAVAGDLFAAYGAKFLTRGDSHCVFEGPDEPRTCVLVEFPSVEKATAFWNSPEYQAAIKIREGAAQMQILVMDGAP